MYNLGGRKFAFVNVGKLGCSPVARFLEKGNKCNEEITEAAKLHNVELYKMLHKLEKQLQGFKYSVFDVYSVESQWLKYPSKYGMFL